MYVESTCGLNLGDTLIDEGVFHSDGIIEVLIDEILVVISVWKGGLALVAFIDDDVDVSCSWGCEDEIDVFVGAELKREFSIEGEVDDLPTVDAQVDGGLFCVIILDLEDVEFLGRKVDKHCWVGYILLKFVRLG